jgi:hypothetical protein
MYQPVPSYHRPFHCIASVSHTLVSFAISVSFLVPSIIIWWTASAHYYPEHNLSNGRKTHAEPKLLFTENPREKRKKKLLDDGGFALRRVLAISTRCFVAFFFFLASAKKGLLPHQIANILEEQGRGNTTFVLFFLSIFFSVSFSHSLSSIPKAQEGCHKAQKADVFFQLSKKRFFSQTFSPSLCDCDYDGNVQRMSCAGCCVWFLSLPLLHVTCLIENCHPRQAIGDRIHDRICDARLNIVGLVLLLHVGGTGRYVYMVHEHEVLNLASSIYILYAMQHDFPATSSIYISNTTFRFHSKASSLPSLCLLQPSTPLSFMQDHSTPELQNSLSNNARISNRNFMSTI